MLLSSSVLAYLIFTLIPIPFVNPQHHSHPQLLWNQQHHHPHPPSSSHQDLLLQLQMLRLLRPPNHHHDDDDLVAMSSETISHRMGIGGIPLEEDSSPKLPLCCDKTQDKLLDECYNNLGPKPLYPQGSWIAPRHLVDSRKETKFKFVSASLSCRDDQFTTTFSLKKPSHGGPLVRQLSTYFNTDGLFKYENEYFYPDQYCISGLSQSEIEVRVCRVDCTHPSTPCIHKCCGMGQIYSFGYGDHPRGCVNLDQRWTPTLYHSLNRRLSPQETTSLRPHIIQRFPTSFKYNCRFNKTTVFPYGEEIANFLSALTMKTFRNLKFHLRKDGLLLYPTNEDEEDKDKKQKKRRGRTFAKKITNYCVDGSQDYGETSTFSNLEDESILFLCSGGVEEAFDTSSSSGNHSAILSNRVGSSTTTKKTSRPPKKTHQSVHHHQHFDLTSSDSMMPSLEIEIEDKTSRMDEQLLPAVIKVAVDVEQIITPKKPPSPTVKVVPIPSCCQFEGDLNDGGSHHCRNKKSLLISPSTTLWKAPHYFTTSRGKEGEVYSLSQAKVTCGGKSGHFQFQGFIHKFEQANTTNSSSGERKNGLLSNGYLKYDNEFYPPSSYCINGLSPHVIEILACKPDCSETPCIKKCCGVDELYSLGLSPKTQGPVYRGCVPLEEGEVPYSPKLYKSLVQEEVPKVQPHFVQFYPPTFQHNCYNRITLAFPFSSEVAERLRSSGNSSSFKHLEFRFRKDGKLLYTYPHHHSRGEDDDGTSFDAIYDRAEFCVDGIKSYGQREGEVFANHENQTILFICASEPHSGEI